MRNAGDYLPVLLGALVVLLVGWLVALIVSAGVRKLPEKTTLDNRLTMWLGLDRGQIKFNFEGP